MIAPVVADVEVLSAVGLQPSDDFAQFVVSTTFDQQGRLWVLQNIVALQVRPRVDLFTLTRYGADLRVERHALIHTAKKDDSRDVPQQLCVLGDGNLAVRSRLSIAVYDLELGLLRRNTGEAVLPELTRLPDGSSLQLFRDAEKWFFEPNRIRLARTQAPADDAKAPSQHVRLLHGRSENEESFRDVVDGVPMTTNLEPLVAHTDGRVLLQWYDRVPGSNDVTRPYLLCELDAQAQITRVLPTDPDTDKPGLPVHKPIRGAMPTADGGWVLKTAVALVRYDAKGQVVERHHEKALNEFEIAGTNVYSHREHRTLFVTRDLFADRDAYKTAHAALKKSHPRAEGCWLLR